MARLVDVLGARVAGKPRAGLSPVDRAVDQVGHDGDRLVDVSDELFCRVALPAKKEKKGVHVSDEFHTITR